MGPWITHFKPLGLPSEPRNNPKYSWHSCFFYSIVPDGKNMLRRPQLIPIPNPPSWVYLTHPKWCWITHFGPLGYQFESRNDPKCPETTQNTSNTVTFLLHGTGWLKSYCCHQNSCLYPLDPLDYFTHPKGTFSHSSGAPAAPFRAQNWPNFSQNGSW